MPHMLLTVEPIGQREARGVEDGKLAYQQMLDFTEELQHAGVHLASSSLATAATRPQWPPGAAARTLDGPFAEAMDGFFGYKMIQVRSLAEALASSRR